jgi:hypothetical protein
MNMAAKYIGGHKYEKHHQYQTKALASAEAERLRKTGKWFACVANSTFPPHYPVVWKRAK